MSAREQRASAELTAETERLVREFFEPQLRTLGLSVEQIEEQGLAQLEASLEVLNDAIANPDSFGKIRLSFAAGTGPIIVRSLSEAHIELGILPILLERKALILNRIRGEAVSFNAAPGSALMQDKFAVLRVEIDGGWSVDDIIKLLTQLEQAYLAAAALESLAEPWSLGVSVSATRPREPTADELMQAVVAFRLGEGLRVQSIHYSSPGFFEFFGALNPLKTVKDGITENRDINRKREETRLFDERERQRQAMEHEQAMEQEHRRNEEMLLTHEREVMKVHIEAETSRVRTYLSVIDRLPPAERTTAAASLFQLMTQNTQSVVNDARVGELKLLESTEPAALPPR